MVYAALKGRIGNNLFQIAAGLTLARQNNTDFAAYIQDFTLPEPDNNTLNEYLGQFRTNLLRNIDFIYSIPENTVIYEESNLSFNKIIYCDGLLINGYFQSEKYFDKKVIREAFSIDECTKAYIDSKYGDILKMGATSINVRRGDFTKVPQNHPVCSFSFYKKAIDYLGKENLFLVISDDIAWCKRKFKGSNFYFVEDENPTVDLYLQTLCMNNIISNSSFSWWGAWLNMSKSKIVIAPSENWVGKYHPMQDVRDLIPEEWVKIPNPIELIIRLKLVWFSIIRILIMVKKVVKGFEMKHNG